MTTYRGNPETYLGDGLYASFDGWSIWLRAPRLDGDHVVALEPAVYGSLQQFIGEIGKATQPPTEG